MSVILPSRIVLTQMAGTVVCPVQIRQNATETVRIDYMTCCIKVLYMCIAQNADKTYLMVDKSSTDFSAATEITFDIWENFGGTLVLSKSLTGADITLANDFTYTFDITSTESGAMSATRKYCETWITASGGDRQISGAGVFEVKDTRKFD